LDIVFIAQSMNSPGNR